MKTYGLLMVSVISVAFNFNSVWADDAKGVSPVNYLVHLHNLQKALLKTNIDNKNYNGVMKNLTAVVQKQLDALNKVNPLTPVDRQGRDNGDRSDFAKRFRDIAKKKLRGHSLKLNDFRVLSAYMGRVIENMQDFSTDGWESQWKEQEKQSLPEHPRVIAKFKKLYEDGKSEKGKSRGFSIGSSFDKKDGYGKFSAKFTPLPVITDRNKINELEDTRKLIEKTHAEAKACYARDFVKAIADVKAKGATRIHTVRSLLLEDIAEKEAAILKEQSNIRSGLINKLKAAIQFKVRPPQKGRYKGWSQKQISDRVVENMVDDFLSDVRTNDALKALQDQVAIAGQFHDEVIQNNKDFSSKAKGIGLKGSRPNLDRNSIVGFLVADISKNWFHQDAKSALPGGKSRSFVKNLVGDNGSVNISSVNRSAWGSYIDTFKDNNAKKDGKGLARYVALENDHLALMQLKATVTNSTHPDIVAIQNDVNQDVASLQDCQRQITQAGNQIKGLRPHAHIGKVAPGFDKTHHDALQKSGKVFRDTSKTYDNIVLPKRNSFVAPNGRPGSR